MTKIGFISLGCSKNAIDTEVMLHKLVTAGYEITPDENEADIKQLMAKKAAKIILLADHTKFDNVAFAKLMDLEAIDVLVTDRRPSEAWIDALAASGVQLLYPEAE